LSSTVRLTAATAASTDAPGAGFSAGTTAFGYWRVIALTASKTAVWTTASAALPGGPGWCAATISPALRFHVGCRRERRQREQGNQQQPAGDCLRDLAHVDP
jgi:hypothetical protein